MDFPNNADSYRFAGRFSVCYSFNIVLVNTPKTWFTSFEWPVAGAYVWSRGAAMDLSSPAAVVAAWDAYQRDRSGGPRLRPAPDADSPRTYRPFDREHAALFRLFAAVDYRDPEAVRTFAAAFGLLGLATTDDGEPLAVWAHEICQMREALELAQPPSATVEAQELAIWNRYVAEMGARWGRPVAEVRAPEAHRRVERQQKLVSLIDDHLKHVRGRMALGPDGPPALTLAPETLLAALWLQLALAVAADKKFVPCRQCGRLLELSTAPTGFRSHREFCSVVCKTQDYRKRKRLARQMAADGASLKDVARAAGTSPATVKAWLAASS